MTRFRATLSFPPFTPKHWDAPQGWHHTENDEYRRERARKRDEADLRYWLSRSGIL